MPINDVMMRAIKVSPGSNRRINAKVRIPESNIGTRGKRFGFFHNKSIVRGEKGNKNNKNIRYLAVLNSFKAKRSSSLVLTPFPSMSCFYRNQMASGRVKCK